MADTELITLARAAEIAGLDATSPPQESRLDGWLIRLSPGLARRARCVNPLAAGTLPLDELLRRCQGAFAAAGLPFLIRITPFSQPTDLDQQLGERGWVAIDAADVLLLPALDDFAQPPELPSGWQLQPMDAAAFAALAGPLRGADGAAIQAHAERLRASPVPYQGFALIDERGQLLACGQLAVDLKNRPLVGLYDINTPAALRGRGLARTLCRALLHRAWLQGARQAYLQMGCDNAAAQALYARLGFVWGYRYHFREPPDVAKTPA